MPNYNRRIRLHNTSPQEHTIPDVNEALARAPRLLAQRVVKNHWPSSKMPNMAPATLHDRSMPNIHRKICRPRLRSRQYLLRAVGLMIALVALGATPRAALRGADRPAPLPVPPDTSARGGQPSRAATGQLNIEGQAIERLMLRKNVASISVGSNNLVVLHRPGPSVQVPAGQYWIEEIELRGGYCCNPPRRILDGLTGQSQDGELLSIGPDKPCRLKIGGPLEPRALAIRQGRTLRIAYELHDADGRMYVARGAKNPPRFVIFSGGQVIGSGSFEYG